MWFGGLWGEDDAEHAGPPYIEPPPAGHRHSVILVYTNVCSKILAKLGNMKVFTCVMMIVWLLVVVCNPEWSAF